MSGESESKRMKEKMVNLMKKYPLKMSSLISRKMLAAMFLFPVLILALGAFWLATKIDSLETLSREVTYLERLVIAASIKAPAKKGELVAVNYVKDVLENLDFLEQDYMVLADLCENVDEKDLFAGIRRRHALLAEQRNRLKFSKKEEGNAITWSLVNPVEMSPGDLLRLLGCIEGEGIVSDKGIRPELYFSKLKIKRAHDPLANLYTVDMELIQKRES